MKNIKYFKYKETSKFQKLLDSYGYKLEDVKGFSLDDTEYYRCNILKSYLIHFNDDEEVCFKVAYFKDFNEYRQSRLGFRNDKLLDWAQDADVVWYKDYYQGYLIRRS